MTIYQVAVEAGVAISTVSKVLSNKPGISDETRVRVREAIDRLGYVPSLAARGLSKGRTGIVAVLFAFPPNQLFTDPYLLKNLQGIKEALDEVDYNLMITTAKEADPSSSFNRLLRSRYYDGVVLMDTAEIHRFLLYRMVANQNLPWVMLGYPGVIPGCSAVFADDYNGGRMVARHLLGLGHTRFAVIFVKSHPTGVDERLRGFLEELAKDGIRVPDDQFFIGDFTQESGYRLAPSVLYRPNRPTAIFSVNDRMALGIMKWAQQQGLRIPDDFSIVGFDDIEASSQSHPELTTIRQPGIEIGARTARMLLRLINGEKGPQQEMVGTELVVRGTTRRALA